MDERTHKLKVAIKTFGCQMNMYDTEVASGLLQNEGMVILPDSFSAPARDGEGLLQAEADVILMNTCSVREHAEDRVYSRLGMLGKAKKQNPDLIVGLMGCMVEEHREKLFKRFPQIDLMVGTRNVSDLPALIEEVRKTRRQVSRIKQDGISIEYTELIKRPAKFHAWLPIMTGCNKVCTFCIVPVTRGAEVSMPAREVYREASRLAGEGVRWITLLGQNVNSYDGQEPGRKIRFPELLEMLCEIKELEQISFTTSHPQDATKELYETIARQPKISRRFHLPLQSGSDRMLKRMKRLHTYGEFREKIELMRGLVPGISVTTDIIAGFSGETEEDHQATFRALEELRFDSAFIYKYSIRPGTPAAQLPDDVSFEDKERRNAQLLELQRKITREVNEGWVGKNVDVFVEGPSVKHAGKLTGRTAHEKRVAVIGDKSLAGRFIRVHLKELRYDTFHAEPA